MSSLFKIKSHTFSPNAHCEEFIVELFSGEVALCVCWVDHVSAHLESVLWW